MAKTLILGNNPDQGWIKEVKDATLMEVPDISLGRSKDIYDFVKMLPADIGTLIIDVDSLASIELSLRIALYTRLMVHECRRTSLSHIIFVSGLTFHAYKGYGVDSMVLMTRNVTFTDADNLHFSIENSRPLAPGEYIEGFLDLIKIVPQESVEGNHSIANEWGAYVLDTVISGGEKSEMIMSAKNTSLYFLYSMVASLTAEDIIRLTDGTLQAFRASKITVTEKFKYLLIDDEASKGWDRVLQKMLPYATQVVWKETATDYNALSEELRDSIENREFKVIFLDLRMAGVSEERISNPKDFSGMKILRSIKKINPGQQVIMLTATNKGWNLQALMEAGANGYYMKESPEYHFPLKYSEQNALAFSKTIKDCVANSFLSEMWVNMRKGVERLDKTPGLGKLCKSVDVNWKSAFILLSEGHYREGLMQLLLALEAYSNSYTHESRTNGDPTGGTAVVYSKDVDFSSPNREEWETPIYDEQTSFFKTRKGTFPLFQKGRHPHTVDVTLEEDSSDSRVRTLTLPIKVAAVVENHINAARLRDMGRVCELVFIRNNRLAHHSSTSEYDERKRPVTRDDCKFVFTLTYDLIMAD